MKYSVGDRVKIVEDGWGCGSQHVGMCGIVESVPTPPYRNYFLRMEDGSTLHEMWEQGFELLRLAESSSASYLLNQMYEAVKHLPNKDWLDPSLERAVKEFLEEVK